MSGYLKEAADLVGGGLMRLLAGELSAEYEVRLGVAWAAAPRAAAGARVAGASAWRAAAARAAAPPLLAWLLLLADSAGPVPSPLG